MAGNYPLSHLQASVIALGRNGYTVLFPGGHCICYRIPGLPGRESRVNWAVYTTPLPVAAGRP